MRDTIDMARESGLERIVRTLPGGFTDWQVPDYERLKAFEALVRADEREQIIATQPAPVQPVAQCTQEAPHIGHDCDPFLADSMKVFCPACGTKFRAIPNDVQELMLDAGFEPPFTAPPAQPAHVPVEWMEMVTANLVREGVNKHKARELAEHFYWFAQRPFVGLTDEEISDIAINNPPMVHEFARAIEAKLKEKNSDR
jgi:hypothetical protein